MGVYGFTLESADPELPYLPLVPGRRVSLAHLPPLLEFARALPGFGAFVVFVILDFGTCNTESNRLLGVVFTGHTLGAGHTGAGGGGGGGGGLNIA